MSIRLKRCTKCLIEKPIEDFWVYRRAKNKTNGRPFPRCKACLKEYKRSWYLRNSEGVSKYNKTIRSKYPVDKIKNRLKRYGMEVSDFYDLIESQHNKCAICENTFEDIRWMFIDHSYLTGKVRGLLCIKCNTGLGQFNDLPYLLRKAATYIEKH